MLETLLALKLPPGLYNNGTAYLAKGRWYAGSLVRFFQGNIQPVGGWVRRTLTGATIAGTPNAMHSWRANDGNAYLAIGTTTHLYIVTSGNVVYDITPAIFDAQPYRWQLENFGAYLVAVPGVSAYASGNPNVFVWRNDVSVAAIQAVADNPALFPVTDGPNSSFGVVVTPERFLVLLRGSEPTALGGGTVFGDFVGKVN